MKFWTLALAIAFLNAAHGADPLPDEVKAYRAHYETKCAEIKTTRDEAVAKALKTYRKELTTLLANVRQQGDLDYVVAIQNELKRTEKDLSAPTEPADKRMKHLRRAQWAARRAEDKANETQETKQKRLDTSYLKSLETLEKRLVAANLIDEAKKAREARDRLAADRAIVGEWLWLGRFERIHGADGTITSKGKATPGGVIAYARTTDSGQYVYQYTLGDGKHTGVAVMDSGGRTLKITTGGGEEFEAVKKP